MFKLRQIILHVLLIVGLCGMEVVLAENESDLRSSAIGTSVVGSTMSNTAPKELVTVDSEQGSSTLPELEIALQRRVERYWEARQARDIRTLYEMESASQPGGWLKLENAMVLRGLPVRKVKVERISIKDDSGKVRISGEVMVGTIGWVPQVIEDSWILIDGKWFHKTPREN